MVKKKIYRLKSGVLGGLGSSDLNFSPCGAKRGVFTRISTSSFLSVESDFENSYN